MEEDYGIQWKEGAKGISVFLNDFKQIVINLWLSNGRILSNGDGLPGRAHHQG